MGDLEQIISFAVLQLGDDACGVTIREDLERRAGRVVSSGAIYTTLGRLEERGLVSSRVARPEPGRPGRPRKYYRLSPAGARALLATYETLRSVAKGVVPELVELAESGR